MIKKLIERYKLIKSDYLSRSPRGKWEFVRNIGIFVLTLTGVAGLDPNFSIHWYSFAPMFTCLDIFISFFYTIWYYKDTPLSGFLVTPLFGVVIPSALCYVLVLIPPKRKFYQSLAFFAGDKIYTDVDQDSDPKYIEACDKCAIELLKSTSKTIGIVLFSMIIMLFFPPFSFVFKNDIQLPIPVVLPFTDLESKSGLILNLANQLFLCLIGATGNIGIEIVTCILKNNVWASTGAICYAIDDISEFIEHPKGNVKRFIDLKFRNILIQVQDHDRFILGLSQLYYWKFFLQPIMLTFSVSFSVFFYLHGDWIGGLGAAFLTYSQLYILCDIGNEVDLANKMLVLKFQKMPWHLMSKENQLRYAHMLNRLQNGAVLRIGPFAELNFETFSGMTNRIYSVLTMLVRFTK